MRKSAALSLWAGVTSQPAQSGGGGSPASCGLFCLMLAIGALQACCSGAAAAQNTLRVVNNCPYPVWIEQQKLPRAPSVVHIPSKGSHTYLIPLSGPQSTRFWPKTGCDAAGSNCTLGQSSPTCPAKGCAPPVDSKLEISWGCLASSCGGKNNETFFNLSQVDGFTLPYSVQAAGAGSNCRSASCPAMSYTASCPAGEDLSTGGHFPALRNQNLRVLDPVTKRPVGCFSPCGKLTFAKAFGGYALAANTPQAGFYCCQAIQGKNPIPSLNPGAPEGCRAGPVPKTKYVKFIDSACNNQVYGYAYDDTHGIRNCIGPARIVFTICPRQPGAAD